MKNFLLTHKKNLLLVIIIILITVEISPYIISPIILKHSFSRKEFKKDLFNLKEFDKNKSEYLPIDENGNHNEFVNTLHPYLGFVSYPHDGYNQFSFSGIDPLLKKTSNSLNICFMGGSVAQQICQSSQKRMIKNLKQFAA